MGGWINDSTIEEPNNHKQPINDLMIWGTNKRSNEWRTQWITEQEQRQTVGIRVALPNLPNPPSLSATQKFSCSKLHFGTVAVLMLSACGCTHCGFCYTELCSVCRPWPDFLFYSQRLRSLRWNSWCESTYGGHTSLYKKNSPVGFLLALKASEKYVYVFWG